VTKQPAKFDPTEARAARAVKERQDAIGERSGVLSAGPASMLGPQVGRVRRIQPQVLDPVVGPNAVDVVHGFRSRQPTAEVLLHHPAVFENLYAAVASPDLASDVSPIRDVARQDTVVDAPTRQRMQPVQTAGP
jgi:hypothetical protein